MSSRATSGRLTVAPSGAPAEAPRVERVGPSFGPAGGGTNVVIMGRGFADGASVSFGGVAATEVAVLGTRIISARTPPHAAGTVDVSVTVPGAGTGALGNAFRYEPAASASRVPPVRRRLDPRPGVVTPR
ncbi:MAG: IPT/TIG domain-containing protein [Thermoanaerobaculia bacterium]